MIFCGCGAMVINDFTGGTITHPGVAITWGLIVLAMIYAFGDISGAHFNPAVTLVFLIRREIKPGLAGWFVIMQICGGLTGMMAAHLMFDLPIWQISEKARHG